MARSARSEDGDQNDFLGSIDIPVQNLPAAGSDKWYKLEGKNCCRKKFFFFLKKMAKNFDPSLFINKGFMRWFMLDEIT